MQLKIIRPGNPTHPPTLSDAITNGLPPYFRNISLQLPYLSVSLWIVIAVGLVMLSTYLFFVIRAFLLTKRVKRRINEQYAFLEVIPTDRTLKTPHSTNQLFTTLHSLIKHESVKKNISFELISTREEGIRYIFRVPFDDISIVKKLLLGHVPGISIKEVTDYIPSEDIKLDKEINTYITKELRLKKHYVFPLQEQELLNQFDPIANLTAMMTKLEKDELVAIQYIATPVHPHTHSSLLEYTDKLRNKYQDNEDFSDSIPNVSDTPIEKVIEFVIDYIIKFLDIALDLILSLFSWASGGKADSSLSKKKKTKKITELGLAKQHLFKTVYDKISEPLFEISVRIYLQTKDKKSAGDRLNGIRSSFNTFSTADQQFELYDIQSKLFPSQLLLPQFLRVNDLGFKQLKYRFSEFSRTPILSVSELSSLYHFPNINSTSTEDLLQIKSPHLPSPISFKQSLREELDIIFAKNVYGETELPIGQIIEERRRHTYIIGASGSGKTTLLLHMIYQDILNGKGLAVLDYHGDLINHILGIIPVNRWKDVVLIDPSNYLKPMSINIMEIKKGLTGIELSQEKGRIASNVISIFKRLSGDYWGPRLEHVLRNTLLTALETDNSTIETVYNLLMKKSFRTPIIATLPSGMLKNFWTDEFEKLKVKEQLEYVIPITNKLNKFLTAEITYNMVSHPKSSIDFEDIMNNNKILLVDLSQGRVGEDNAFFIGSLIVGKIHLTALRRVNIPEDDRVDFFLYIDEFQYFATDYFTDIFSGARKYRLDIIIAHQNVSQITEAVFESITGNAGTTISFRLTGPRDEEKILPIFKPKVEEGQLRNLPTFTFYIKIHGTKPQDAFTGEIERFSIKSNDETRRSLIKLSQEKYSVDLPNKRTIETINQKTTKKSSESNRNVNKKEINIEENDFDKEQ